jgi:hypothetical protein
VKGTIEKIVGAVRNAQLENEEITVVDDCPQDGTLAILQERMPSITAKAQLCARILGHADPVGVCSVIKSSSIATRYGLA